MKRSDWLTPVCIVLAGIVVGCAMSVKPTPRQSYSSLNDTFISGVTILTAAGQSGAMSEKELTAVVPYVVATDKLLDAYDAATKAGLDGGTILDQIKAALTEIAPYVEKAQAKGVKPNVGSSASPRGVGSPGSDGSGLKAEYEVGGRTRSLHRDAERYPSQTRVGAGGVRGPDCSRCHDRGAGGAIAA